MHTSQAKANARQSAEHESGRATFQLIRPAQNPREERLRAIWLNAMLWTFQGWLAMFFAGAAIAKLTAPTAHLDILLGWSEWAQLEAVRLMGGLDALLAVAMLAPLFGWRIGRPVLVGAATTMLVIELVFLGVHLLRLEFMLAAVNLVLIGLTVPVANMRRYLPA